MAESRVFKLMNGVTLEMLGEAVESFLRDSKGSRLSQVKQRRGILYKGNRKLTVGKNIRHGPSDKCTDVQSR